MTDPAAAPGHPDPGAPPLQRLSGLLALERRLRRARGGAELAFLMVNDTHALVPYRQAALWRADRAGLAALSGLAQVEADAPFVVWLTRLCRHLERTGAAGPLTAADLPEDLAGAWGEWLPAHALWLPLRDPARGDTRDPAHDEEGREAPPLGALLLAREAPWSAPDRALLDYLADAYGHAAGRAFGPPPGAFGRWAARWAPPRRRAAAAVLAVLAALALVPVRLSVLAPAEVIAAAPVVVRAPVEGVVDRVAVRPNELVQAGQPLFALDPTRLLSRREVAAKALEVAEAEWRQAQQQAVVDAKAKAQLAVLQGKRDQHAAELAYVASLLERLEVKAPRAGVAIFDDVNDWIGKPVTVGERVLMVADPHQVELEIRLPIADAIPLEPGAEVALFLNVDPQAPVPGRLTVAGYRAQPGADGVLAYRLKTAFAAEDPRLRVGLKGVAKLYGQEVRLFHYLFRRPLAAVRHWLPW